MSYCEQWIKKAMAFLIRTEHQLWGKHSEDVLAELFVLGFKNSFIKENMFGWNKKLTLRTCESWGIKNAESEFITLEEGIVIPYIKNKSLLKLFIAGFDEKGLGETKKIDGSSLEPVFWHSDSKNLIACDNMLLSCYLSQEYGNDFDIINICDDEIKYLKDIKLSIYEKIFVFKSNGLLFDYLNNFCKERIIFVKDNPFDKKPVF